MKIRNDIVQVYKDVHIWVGILSGLMLFIAFYAGAITMFEQPLAQWATPPSSLPAPPPLRRTDALVEAVLVAHPEAAKSYTVMLAPTVERPARVVWETDAPRDGESVLFGAGFAGDGSLRVERLRTTPVAATIDTLHQLVGLPFPDAVARPIMGAVALLYALALVSGLIVLLTTLAKDVFALRIGNNIKRLWLDVHNALGLFSLPFHLVIALTSVVFAFNGEFYGVQEKMVYIQPIDWNEAESAPPPAGARPLPILELLRRVQTQLPSAQVQTIDFEQHGTRSEGELTLLDTPRGTTLPSVAYARVDPYTGAVDMRDLPEHADGWNKSVNAFFMLHFGSFGGNPMRWLYLLMGLAGAAVFYSGNLLWVESRRKKMRGRDSVPQKRSAKGLACLTVGVSLGCVAGISATIAAAKWLPARVGDLQAWHTGIYYAIFLAAVAWAFLRGPARGAVELLRACALLTLAIPLSSLAGRCGIGGSWSHAGTWPVDATALLAVPVLLYLAHRTRLRMRNGHTDSVWSHRRDVAASA